MHPYLQPVTEMFKEAADPETATSMKQYMRQQFEFFGIKTPQRRKLQKKLFTQYDLPPFETLETIILQLWALPEREYQLTAMDILDRFQKKLTPDHVAMIEALILTKSWWDTVDGLAARQISRLFLRYPEIRDEHIGRWRKSDNIWLRRTTLLFQLSYKEKTDEELLCNLLLENLGSEEFFIQKAMGWALREYSKTSPQSVLDLVIRLDLPKLTSREAMKWIEKNKHIDYSRRMILP